MIWILRYISVRLWLSVLFSLPASIYLIQKFNSFSPDTSPAVIFVCITLFFFIIISLILDFVGKKIIEKLIKEGAAWERAEIYRRSEEKYYKALRIYDSFLISPFAARGCAEKISEAIAKFTAVSEINDATFNKTATLFLKLSPADEHMALLWLKKLFKTPDLDLNTMDHDTLTLIAENHYNNPKILPLLTNIFVQLERTDFTAQKVYKKALAHLKKESKKRTVIQNLVREAEDEGELPSELSFARPPARKKNVSAFIKKTGIAGVNFLKYIQSKSKKIFHLLTTDEKIKKTLKYSVVLLCFCLAVFFMFTFISSLVKPKPEKIEIKKKIVAAPAPQMPYTIQTAAFLSRPHAEKYTDKLKKSGLDARFVKVEGKNKTWFLVRISKFPDKSSAAAYGQKLKSEGLIKDFFVANK